MLLGTGLKGRKGRPCKEHLKFFSETHSPPDRVIEEEKGLIFFPIKKGKQTFPVEIPVATYNIENLVYPG